VVIDSYKKEMTSYSATGVPKSGGEKKEKKSKKDNNSGTISLNVDSPTSPTSTTSSPGGGNGHIDKRMKGSHVSNGSSSLPDAGALSPTNDGSSSNVSIGATGTAGMIDNNQQELVMYTQALQDRKSGQRTMTPRSSSNGMLLILLLLWQSIGIIHITPSALSPQHHVLLIVFTLWSFGVNSNGYKWC
jgi:hypothetical protein